jgi:hypothetical protein
MYTVWIGFVEYGLKDSSYQCIIELQRILNTQCEVLFIIYHIADFRCLAQNAH